MSRQTQTRRRMSKVVSGEHARVISGDEGFVVVGGGPSRASVEPMEAWRLPTPDVWRGVNRITHLLPGEMGKYDVSKLPETRHIAAA